MPAPNYPAPFDRVVVGRERKRLGNAAGLDQFGVNLTTLKPGAASALRHWHEQEDEFVYMLEGEVVLIEDDGETVLEAGRCRGLQGQQRQRPSSVNRTNRDAVYLEIGTRSKARTRRISRCRSCWSCATTKARATPTRTAIRMSESGAMTFTNFTLDIDGDGIALVTWNAPGRTMNVIDATVIEELSAIVEELATDGAVKGVVITSGKDTFCAGADLTMLETLSRTFADLVAAQGEEAANARLFRGEPQDCRCSTAASKPAASRGSRRSTARRSAAASSWRWPAISRIAADNAETRLGLPEIKIGLFPGAGGTQRIARMLPPADALQFLLKGDQLAAQSRQGDEARRCRGAGRRSHQGGEGLDQVGRHGQGAVGRRRLQAAGRPGLFESRHDGVPAGERDLSPRDLRQLSGRARHHAGRL